MKRKSTGQFLAVLNYKDSNIGKWLFSFNSFSNFS